jgi:DNA-binding transcriptional ArsR family regulator
MKTKAAQNKAKMTDDEIDLIANKFKVLSEVSRMKIIRSLVVGEKCVSDIISDTGLLQANVSKQLKLMLLNGVLLMRKSGLQRYYSIADQAIIKVCLAMCNREED